MRIKATVGKQGGIESTRDLRLDGTGSTIDGGSGPGIEAGMNSHISFKQGTLKGTPAIKTTAKPMRLELDGTNVIGERQIAAR